MKAPLPPAQPVVELAPPAAGKLFRPAGIPLRRWAALLLAALGMRIVAVIGEPVIPRDGVWPAALSAPAREIASESVTLLAGLAAADGDAAAASALEALARSLRTAAAGPETPGDSGGRPSPRAGPEGTR